MRAHPERGWLRADLCAYPERNQERPEVELLCDFARRFVARVPHSFLQERSREQLAALTTGAFALLGRARPDQGRPGDRAIATRQVDIALANDIPRLRTRPPTRAASPHGAGAKTRRMKAGRATTPTSLSVLSNSLCNSGTVMRNS